MIHLYKGQTNRVILTLTENQTIAFPYYLFKFINRSSNWVKSFVISSEDDLSFFKDRYNEFQIITDNYFKRALAGQYTYEVYEQSNAINTDSTGLNLLETGIMELHEEQVVYSQYQPKDTIKIRQ